MAYESLIPCSENTLKRARRLVKKGNVSDVEISGGILSGVVIGKSGETYEPYIKKSGRYSCGCKAGRMRGILCSHNVALLLSVGKKAKNFIEAIITSDEKISSVFEPKYVSTPLENFNSLVGGLPLKTGVILFGQYEAGKSILAYQLSYTFDGNIVLLETEGKRYTYLSWIPVFDDVYKKETQLVKVDVRLDEDFLCDVRYTPEEFDADVRTIFVLDIKDIETILSLFGRSSYIDISDEGKLTLKPIKGGWTSVFESPIGELIDSNDIKLLIYDSITNPILEFGYEQPSFPARHAAATRWLLQTNKLLERYNLSFIGIVHETINPAADRFHKKPPRPVGGKAVGHGFEFDIYVEVSDKKGKENDRKLYVTRHPRIPPWGESTEFELTDEGFVDV